MCTCYVWLLVFFSRIVVSAAAGNRHKQTRSVLLARQPALPESCTLPRLDFLYLLLPIIPFNQLLTCCQLRPGSIGLPLMFQTFCNAIRHISDIWSIFLMKSPMFRYTLHSFEYPFLLQKVRRALIPFLRDHPTLGYHPSQTLSWCKERRHFDQCMSVSIPTMRSLCPAIS